MNEIQAREVREESLLGVNPFEGMSHQEIFDVALNATVKQGCAAMDQSGFCLYRTDEGNRCAIGHVMVGKVPEQAEIWSRSISAQEIGCALGLPSETVGFLRQVQRAHDCAADEVNWDQTSESFMDEFLKRMRAVASDNELVWNGPF